jgi:hypothetical protein
MTIKRYGTSCTEHPEGIYVLHKDYLALEAEVEELRLNERSDTPKRAVQFALDLQADDIDSLCSALFNLSSQIAARDMSRTCTSGGYDSGYTYRLSVSESPAHDEYVRQLNAWLEYRAKEKA